ncbi:MAG TPA: DUF4159 domain-containing protein [Candidatus Acidoferrales bacterium]
MTLRPLILLAALSLVAAQVAQVPEQGEQGDIEMDGKTFAPPNPREKAEWTFARFHYDLGYQYGRYGFERWAADWPKADRQFILGVRRLTRVQSRSTEQVVDANSDDLYNWPWIYVEDPGGWRLSEKQAARLREYLLRGGFLMADDSHGDYEWDVLVQGMRMIFPDRQIEDLPDSDEIFHVVYDLDDRVQIPGTRYIWGPRWSYGPDSATPKWRGIRDDKGRIMIAICHNSDVGDAWEWADSPRYPEHEASVAYRIGVNYIIYGMTH